MQSKHQGKKSEQNPKFQRNCERLNAEQLVTFFLSPVFRQPE